METETNTIYTASAGTNCVVNGEHGYVTELHHDGKHLVGAFVHVPPASSAHGAPGHMLYVKLGNLVGERGVSREILSSRLIDRDEFDRLNTLDTLRTELGWRA